MIEITKSTQIWQAEIENKIQETNLEELKNWIKTGKLSPSHNVRVKNLIWVEAQKVPAFAKLFEDKKNGKVGTLFQLPNSIAPTIPTLEQFQAEIRNDIKSFAKTVTLPIPEVKNEVEEHKKEEVEGIHFSCPSCKSDCILQTNEDGVQTAILKSENDDQSKSKKSKVKELEDFKILVPLERDYRSVGLISAFLMSLLFSVSIAYFWVFQLTFTEEPAKTNAPKTAEQNNQLNPTTGQPNAVQGDGSEVALNTKQALITPDGKCIDQQTKEPFECDEATKKVFEEENKKKESVANAQKQVSEKTNTILSLIMPSSRAPNENGTDNNESNQSLIEEFKNDPEKQRFLQIFGVSFIAIFGLLILSRLLSKRKKLPPQPA